MKIMKAWLITLMGIFILVVNFFELVKEIKEMKEIKIKLNDKNIRAIVVSSLPCITGDVKPILKYAVKGMEKFYTYHFYYDEKKYPIGKKVTLKFSEDSELAYDRTDLIKAFVYRLFAEMFSVFIVCFCVYYIIFFV